MWTAQFWKETAERVIFAVATALSAFFVVGKTDLMEVDWSAVLSGAGVAAISAVLFSLITSGIGPKDSPSVVGK